jgi:hypothetical protein
MVIFMITSSDLHLALRYENNIAQAPAGRPAGELKGEKKTEKQVNKKSEVPVAKKSEHSFVSFFYSPVSFLLWGVFFIDEKKLP